MQSLEGLAPLNAPKRRTTTGAKTPEGKVKQQIRAIFDEFGAYVTMPATHGYGSSGVPDFLACVNGKFVAVEAKSKLTSHGVTRLQEKNIHAIRNAGGIAIVVDEDNLDELRTVLEGVTNG